MKLSLSTSLSGFTKSVVPFVGEFDELGSDGTTLRWTAMAGAEGYHVEAFGAADLSGGALGDIIALGTSLDLSLLSLSAGNYWIRVKAVQGALEKVWRDGGLPYAIGSSFTDLVGWATSSIWVYCRDTPFVVTTGGVVTGISPPTGYVTVTGGSGWKTGHYPVDGSAKDYVYDPSALSMLHLPDTFVANGTGSGVGYWMPYVTPAKQVVFDGNSLMNNYATETGVNNPVQSWTLFRAGRKWFNGGNFAVNAQTTTNMIADAVAEIDPQAHEGGIQNVLVAWEITNELYGGVSAATAIANFKTYCAARRAAGFYVVAVTVIARTESGGSFTNANRLVVNAELLNPANLGVYWDAVADTTSDSRLEDETDTTYFNADQLHLKAAGYSIVGQLVGDILATL